MHALAIMMVMLGIDQIRGEVSCIGEDGKAVDMFIIYKLPRVAAWPGDRYVYLDPHDVKFRPSKHQISSNASAIGMTLNQVYAKYYGGSDDVNRASQGLAHIFYNDAIPGAKKYDHSFGHMKGELAFDEEAGFWVIQSVPNFPTRISEGYHYPRTGYKYGQMMMCISFKSSAFRDIGLQLKYAKPHIYDSNLPIPWRNKYKEIYDVIRGNFLESSPAFNIATLTSSKGVKYLHFGKNARYGHDLYHHLMAPRLKTNLITETWQHGKKNIGPSCKGNYTVVDVRKVSLKTLGTTYSFLTRDDHSKYAIGELSGVPYVCVGDINRQYSQYKRGGGSVCTENFQLWNQFKSLVAKSDTCEEC